MTAPAFWRHCPVCCRNGEKLREMSARARTFAHPQAAARIAEMVALMAKRNG